MEKLLKYIKENFSEGEPILVKDLKQINISYDNLRQKLKKLTDNNKLNRISDREGLLNPGDTGTVSLQTSGTEQTLSLMKAMFIEAKEMTDPETN